MNYERKGKTWEPRVRYGYSLGSGRGFVPCAFWKKVAVLAAIIVVYAAVQLAISWPAIKWMAKENGTVKNEKVMTSTLFHFSLCLLPLKTGGAA